MAKASVLAGATSQSFTIFIQDSSSTVGAGLAGLAFNTSGLIAYYTFTGANAGATAITLATLAAVNSAYSSGGFKEIDSTNMKGLYRVDVPNAAIAASKGRIVTIMLSGATNMAPLALEIELTGWDNQDGVRGGLTALPNAAANAAGGLPISIAGGLDLDEQNADIEAIQAAQLTAVQIATGVWQDTTAGDFTVAASIGKSVMNGVALGTGLTINAYTGNTPQTGDNFPRLGAPAGASVSADIAAIKSDTGTTLTDVNTGAGAIYTRIGAPVGASIAADIAAVKTDLDAGVNVTQINGNATAAANVAHTNQALTRGTVGAASSVTSITTSAITSPASVGASGQFDGRIILFDADTASANLQGQATNITGNTTGATPTFTVTALTTAPASGDKFTIV